MKREFHPTSNRLERRIFIFSPLSHPLLYMASAGCNWDTNSLTHNQRSPLGDLSPFLLRSTSTMPRLYTLLFALKLATMTVSIPTTSSSSALSPRDDRWATGAPLNGVNCWTKNEPFHQRNYYIRLSLQRFLYSLRHLHIWRSNDLAGAIQPGTTQHDISSRCLG